MTPSLTLTPTSGTALDLIGGNVRLSREVSIESFLPVPTFDEGFAESVDTEGGKRIYSRPQNAGGSGKVLITGTSTSNLWTNVRTWQQTVTAVSKVGGTFTYTPEGGTQVTYDIESIRITSLPQDNVLISGYHVESTFDFTCRPYGRLASQTLISSLSFSHPIIGIDLGDRAYATVVGADTPTAYWRLGTSGTTDSSGNSNNGTGAGGITIGGATGLITGDTDAATTFDGTDDRISSSLASWDDTNTKTFEVWSKITDTTADRTIFSGDGSTGAPSLKVLSGGADVRFRVRDSDSGATSSTTWTAAYPGANVTTHVVLIWTPGSDIADLWINGISQGVKTGLTQTMSTPGNVILGVTGSSFTSPYKGALDEFALYGSRLRGERILAHYVAGVERTAVSGSVDGLGLLTLTDQASTNRNHVEWGIEENYNPASPTPVILTSVSLDTSGFAGSANTRAGAYDPVGAGNTTIRGTLTNTPIVVCGTGSQAHVGRWRVRARVYQSGTGKCRVRLSWRVGKADAFTRNAWVTLGTSGQWFEPDLGLVDIPSALIGSQSWEGWIESYSSVVADTLDVNYVEFIPAARYGKARGPIVAETAGNFSARDEFDQTAGAVTGKTLPVGGTWSGSGDADDASVEATGHTLQRTAVSDADYQTGRFLRASTPTLTNLTVQGDVKFTALAENLAVGLLGRYTDTSNYAGLWLLGSSVPTYNFVLFAKKVAGSLSAVFVTPASTIFGQLSTWFTLRLTIDADGNWAIWAVTQGAPLLAPLATGQDSVFATGGTLASGAVGLYDANPTATASTRSFDNFSAWVPTVNPHVLNSGKRLQVDYQSALREPTSGTNWGRVPSYEGSYVKIPPAGNENKVSRLVIKARSFDIDQAASSAPAKVGVDCSLQPRVVLLG